MEVFGVVALGIGVVGVSLIGVLYAEGPPTLGALFQYRPPGWPSGIQEDDDIRWRWDPPRASPRSKVTPVPALERVKGVVRAR
jgi:hypothetical protein